MKNNYLFGILFAVCFLGKTPQLTAQCLVSVDAGEDLYMCTGRTLKLDGSIEGYYLSYLWNPWLPQNKNHEFNPYIPITQTVTYTLTARSYDPTQNLIQNPDFESGNVGFESDFAYNPGNIVPPGTYDVLTNPQAANDALDPCGDHTSGSGNMLIVHPSPQNVGEAIWRQSVSVTPNTQYFFAFWSTLAAFGTQSTLVLFVNDVPVSNLKQSTNSPCNWRENRGMWFSDMGTTVANLSIRITNAGNAIALDDIFFGPFCEVSDDVTFFVGQPQAVAAPASYIVPCEGFEQTLSGTGSSAGPQFEYLWETSGGNIVSGENTLHPVVNAPGLYTLTVNMPNALGGDCPHTTSVNVAEVHPPLATWITTIQSLNCNNNTVLLNGQVNQPASGFNFQWMAGQGGNVVSGANSASAAVNQPGEYTLMVTNTTTGCTSETSYLVASPVPPTASIQPPPVFQNPNDTLTLSATITPANGIVLWSTPNGHIAGGANSLTPQITSPGTYLLTATNPVTGCTSTARVEVLAVNTCPFAVDAGPDQYFCNENTVSVQLDAYSGDAFQFQWSAPWGTLNPSNNPKPIVTVDKTTTFYLTGIGYDPNDNLLVNGDFEQGNVGFTSDYFYSPGDLEILDSYDVLSNPQAANMAYLPCPDHTSGGGMMLATGRALPEMDVWRQTVQVTPNTKYYFSGWALRLLTTKSNLRLLINNDFMEVPIPTPESCNWKNFTMEWNSGNNTTAELVIKKISFPAAFALDDLYFGPLCEAVDSVTIHIATLNANATTTTQLQCEGHQVSLSGAGSSQGPNIGYEWTTSDGNIVSNGNTLNPIISSEGTYTLTVHLNDPNYSGCSSTATVHVFPNPNPLTTTILPNQPGLTCSNPQTTLTAIALPSANTTYQWTAGLGGNIVSGINTALVAVNQPGVYTVQITNTVTSCTATATYQIAPPVPPTANIQPPPVLQNPTDTLILSAMITPANGTVSWSSPDGLIIAGSNTLNPQVATPGLYILTVTDPSNGCTSATSVLVQLASGCPLSVYAGTDAFLCEPGDITLAGSAFGQYFDLLWSPDIALSDPAVLNPVATVSLTTEYTLTARTYDPMLNLLANPDFETGSIDFTSDLAHSPANLNLPGRYAVLMNPKIANPAFPTCGDHTSGSGNMLAISPTGSTARRSIWCQTIPVAPATEYLLTGWVLNLSGQGSVEFWINNDSVGVQAIPADTCNWDKFSGTWYSGAQTVAVVCADTREPNVALALDDLFFTPLCKVRDTVVVVVADEPVLAVANAPDILDCADGSVALHADGSSQGSEFSYAWSTPNGHIEIGANTPTPTVNAPGVYFLVVTNTDNGCTAEAETTVQEDISAPDITVIPAQALTCTLANQTLIGQNAGTSGTFLYQWTASPGGNIATGETTLEPEITAPGTYTLLATNVENGCTAVVETIVEQDISTPEIDVLPALPLTCIFTNQTLIGQNTGPSGNFTYQWTTSDGGNIAAGETTLEPEIDAPGTYTLLATNVENGCTAIGETTVLQDVSAPDIAVLPAQPLTCILTNQILQGQNAGPSGNFTYQWTASGGGNIAAGETTLEPEIDAPGTYALLATNLENGCTATAEITISQNDEVSVALTTQTDATCFGAADGMLGVAAAGGDGAFTYLWENGADTPVAGSLSAGAYTVVVTDGAGCTAIIEATVDQPEPVAPNATATGATVPGGSDGSATATPSGGTMPYTFAWIGGSTEQTISNIPAGLYTVTVTDANGCTAEQTVEVVDIACSLIAGLSAADPLCFGAADGSATAAPLGGAAPFTYLWSNGANGQTAIGLEAGEYSVVVTDVHGCAFTATATLYDPVLLTLESAVVTDASCPDTPDGSASVAPSGGTGNVSIVWDNGQLGATATNLPAGEHIAIATDANGCIAEAIVTVQATDAEPPVIQSAPAATVWLGPAGGITLTLQNLGVNAFDNCGLDQVQIEPGNFDCLQLGLQTVTITVTDMSGNTAVQTVEVTVADNLAPEVECPGNEQRCYDDRTVQYLAPVATDNCLILGGQFDLVEGLPSGSTFPEGITSMRYTFLDASGNVGSCSFTVTILSPVVVTLDALLDDLAGQNIGSVLVKVNGSKPGYTYEWRRDGVVFAATQDLIGVGAGSYTLLVTDSEGCTASAGPFVVDDLVGTDNPEWANQVAVFPNPTAGRVVVVMPDNMAQETLRFTVFDATGKLVLEEKTGWKKQVELDWTLLPEGLYTLRILTDDGQSAYRVAVHRR